MNMIAKFRVTDVKPFQHFNGKTGEMEPVSVETLKLMAVTEKPFDAEGASEDNSFARWTPSGTLEMTVTNPALFGKFKVGQNYYLTFEEAK